MENSFTGKGVFLTQNEILLIYNNQRDSLRIAKSKDMYNFNSYGKLLDKKNADSFKDFRITRLGKNYFTTCKFEDDAHYVISDDFSKLEALKKFIIKDKFVVKETSALAPYKHENKYIMYYGNKLIKIAYSSDLNKWRRLRNAVLSPRENHFDKSRLHVGNVFITNEGLVVFYYTKNRQE